MAQTLACLTQKTVTEDNIQSIESGSGEKEKTETKDIHDGEQENMIKSRAIKIRLTTRSTEFHPLFAHQRRRRIGRERDHILPSTPNHNHRPIREKDRENISET